MQVSKAASTCLQANTCSANERLMPRAENAALGCAQALPALVLFHGSIPFSLCRENSTASKSYLGEQQHQIPAINKPGSTQEGFPKMYRACLRRCQPQRMLSRLL